MYNRIKYYPFCLILGYTVSILRRFIELWDVQLGFGWAMAASVTTGLFGFWLLIVYGRLGKLNKLFKQKYQYYIPSLGNHEPQKIDNEIEMTPKSQRKGTKQKSNRNLTSIKSKPSIPPNLQFNMSNTKLDVLAESVKIQEKTFIDPNE